MQIKNKLTKLIITLSVLCPITAVSYVYKSIPEKITISQQTAASDTDILSYMPLITTASENIYDKTGDRNYTLSLKLFNKIPFKNVDVEVMPKVYVIPSGEPIGVKMYTDGILIVGISYVTDSEGRNIYPARDAGIHEGDIIKKINGAEIHSIEDMSSLINDSGGNVTATIERGRTVHDVDIAACRSSDDGNYRLGIWVRDTAAGVGTMTFYDPDTKSFASLGHAITDTDTGDILKLGRGEVISCRILAVNKGSKGEPGELIGTFTDNTIGKIFVNGGLGVYGRLENYPFTPKPDAVAVATRFEIQNGNAYILADVDGKGIERYDVEILRCAKDNSQNNKGIVFKVTDEKLLEKTGGIVQGMSGCPIMQNDMLIGAVTHVFVNDPTKGYGIFAENMIDTIRIMENDAA
ncbi:MAG: SpoIVB peptidase [Oscillospiraceae bacterium]|nr:SpoIVB peptidase [Oscillospiraceae bacterium]